MKIREFIGEEKIVFDNGTIMQSFHCHDCCENHWAELSKLKEYNINPKTGDNIDIMQIEFPENIHEHLILLEDEGFNIVAKDGSKYFVPGYGENNGYYSTDITLIINYPNGKKIEVDLTKCQKIDWY